MKGIEKRTITRQQPAIEELVAMLNDVTQRETRTTRYGVEIFLVRNLFERLEDLYKILPETQRYHLLGEFAELVNRYGQSRK